MTSIDTISVIVSIYNVEPYVNRCIESIVSQTYDALEIILVDDGSLDRSGKICDEWAVKDPRIIVIHQCNQGISAARNSGLNRASGTFIALIDGDDFLREDMLKVLYDRMNTDHAQMAICNYIQTDAHGNHIGGPNGLHVTENSCVDIHDGLRMFNNEQYLFAAVVWNKLYLRKLWNGIRFPRGKICEDGYVMHKVIGRCERISIEKDRLYRYVQRDDSILHSGLTIRNLTHIEACYHRIRYCEKNGYQDLCPDGTKVMMQQYFWLRKEIPVKNLFDRLCFLRVRIMVSSCCRRYGIAFQE